MKSTMYNVNNSWKYYMGISNNIMLHEIVTFHKGLNGCSHTAKKEALLWQPKQGRIAPKHPYALPLERFHPGSGDPDKDNHCNGGSSPTPLALR